MNKFSAVLTMVFAGIGLALCASPEGPILHGEKTEKTRRYENVASRSRHFFHQEDECRLAHVEGDMEYLEWPDNLKTPEQARERFEKNSAAATDLLGWRMPFEDFCKSGNRWLDEIALTDILAKERFLEELFSQKMNAVAPDIAREQFEMSLRVVRDIFSELEFISPEKRYRPIFELQGKWLCERNLPQALAKFLYIRQIYLEKIRKKILLRERDALIYWSECEPAKIREYFAPLKNAARNLDDVPVAEDAWIGRLDHDELARLFRFIGMEPMSEELRARMPALQKSLHDYWLTWWRPNTGGCGSGM